MFIAIDIESSGTMSGMSSGASIPTGTLTTRENAGDLPSGVLKVNNCTYAWPPARRSAGIEISVDEFNNPPPASLTFILVEYTRSLTHSIPFLRSTRLPTFNR